MDARRTHIDRLATILLLSALVLRQRLIAIALTCSLGACGRIGYDRVNIGRADAQSLPEDDAGDAGMNDRDSASPDTGDSMADGGAELDATEPLDAEPGCSLPVRATGGTESVIQVNSVDWKVHTFDQTGDDAFTIECSDSLTVVEYLVVGGGSGPLSAPGFYLAGGGGGAVNTGSVLLAPGVHPIRVGAGGAGIDLPGELSSAFSIESPGAPTVANGPGGGGASGSSAFQGGLSEGHSGSGGGAGAGGSGGNADWGNFWNNWYFWGGKGGIGIQSDITGVMLGYGGGGSGQGWHFNVNTSNSKSGGASYPGDFRALATDGGGTAVHCPVGGVLDASCGVPLEGYDPRPNSGGGGSDVNRIPVNRSGADGVVIVRYPLSR
jgi:hypothetical protein